MNPSRRRFIKIVAAQSAGLALGQQACRAATGPSSQLRSWSGIVLGAEASIQLACQDAKEANRILKLCVSEIQRLERIFSLYDENSAVARLNRDKLLSQPPKELLELVRFSQTISAQTRGVFDITIQPLVQAYRAHFSASRTEELPDLDAILPAVNFRHIHAAAHQIRLHHPQSSITLNGVAQGFITDKIAELMRSFGLGHTLIDLGEKRALDSHPSGRPWRLALANQSGSHSVVELNNQALSSSGGYGTPFDSSGAHHHLLDPRTGRSVSHHASVHVRAANATLADALSTALATCRPDEEARIEANFPSATVTRSQVPPRHP